MKRNQKIKRNKRRKMIIIHKDAILFDLLKIPTTNLHGNQLMMKYLPNQPVQNQNQK